MQYLDMQIVEARQITKPPVSGQTHSGYGSRIPTQYLLLLERRWHRVYSICWGNASTCYVRKGGAKLYIATGEL